MLMQQPLFGNKQNIIFSKNTIIVFFLPINTFMQKKLFLTAIPFFLAACGGGGGGSSDSSTTNNTSPYQVQTVVGFTDNTFATVSSITPSAQAIPSNSATGLFSTSASFTNGTRSWTNINLLSSSTALAIYNNNPSSASTSLTQVITGGYGNWSSSRFGLFTTRDVTATNTQTYIEMPYAAVSSSPASVVATSYTNALGKIVGVISASTATLSERTMFFCNATGSLAVSGTTKTVTLSYSGCKDNLSSGAISGNAFTTAGTITLSTADDSVYSVSGSGFTFTTYNGTSFTPASYRGDFKLAGSSGSELVGRVYMTDSTGQKHVAFAFGIK